MGAGLDAINQVENLFLSAPNYRCTMQVPLRAIAYLLGLKTYRRVTQVE